MHLIFDRGDHDSPSGHALIYFRCDDGAVLATYVSVPPIQFDLKNYVPGFLVGAMQGMDLGESMVAAPMPPIAEEVPSTDYLAALAERRRDDLVFAGATTQADPMRVASDTAEAAREYGDLYQASSGPRETAEPVAPVDDDTAAFEQMDEEERLKELTRLTGRLRDALSEGSDGESVERPMQRLASLMPAKYRAGELIAAAAMPGERGQKLAGLHLERCYKLYSEDYLALERLDREIAELGSNT